MKRTLAILVPSVLLLAVPAAHADAYDNFPLANPAPAGQAARTNLCEHRAVREAARIHRDLQPVQDAVAIATNPTGFAMKLVNDHVVRIPSWVGFAMDPPGYVKAKAIARVREEAKKAAGVEKNCADES